MKLLLFHGAPFPLKFDKETSSRILSEAEARIGSELGFEKNSAMTVYTLTQHPEAKMLEKTLRLPENTPDSHQWFFKSDQQWQLTIGCDLTCAD